VEAATVSATAVETTAATVEATAYEATTATQPTTVAATVSAPAASSPTVTVPRPSAEEDAAVEPLRTIVAVGRAGIGRVSVVAILTIGQNVSVNRRRCRLQKKSARGRRAPTSRMNPKIVSSAKYLDYAWWFSLLSLLERHMVLRCGRPGSGRLRRVRTLQFRTPEYRKSIAAVYPVTINDA